MKGKKGYSESGVHLACVVLPHSVVHFFFFLNQSLLSEGSPCVASVIPEMLLIAVVFLVWKETQERRRLQNATGEDGERRGNIGADRAVSEGFRLCRIEMNTDKPWSPEALQKITQ